MLKLTRKLSWDELNYIYEKYKFTTKDSGSILYCNLFADSDDFIRITEIGTIYTNVPDNNRIKKLIKDGYVYNDNDTVKQFSLFD